MFICVMLFKYCPNPDADKPTMLLLEDIGVSTNGDGITTGISGAQFASELFALDEMGKKEIDIMINSPGGSVYDAMAIFGAMMKIKAKVNTHNLGLAASAAGILFVAGRNRTMCDYAVVMVHDVHNGTDENDPQLDTFRNSVNTMLSQRTGKSPEEITLMMSGETWMSADEAKANGFCDAIEASGQSNRPRLKKGDAVNNYQKAKAYINKAHDFNPTQTMKKVTNKLALVEGANEDQILSAIETIENKAKEIENKAAVTSEALKKAEEECKAAQAKYDALKKDYDEMKNKVDAEAAEKKEKEEKELEDKVGNLVTNAVKAGKIQNKAEAIEKWKNLAKADFDTTKAALDAIAVNKKAGNVVNTLDNPGEEEKAVPSNAAGIMAQISNKFKQR